MRFEEITKEELGFIVQAAIDADKDYDVWGPTPGSHDYKNFPNDRLWTVEVN